MVLVNLSDVAALICSDNSLTIPTLLTGWDYREKPEIGPEKSCLVNFVACYVRF
jgi:hypothetical protein